MPETRAIVSPDRQRELIDQGFILNRVSSRSDFFRVIFPEGTLEARLPRRARSNQGGTIWCLPNGELMVRWDPTDAQTERSLGRFQRGLLSMWPPNTLPQEFYASPA